MNISSHCSVPRKTAMVQSNVLNILNEYLMAANSNAILEFVPAGSVMA